MNPLAKTPETAIDEILTMLANLEQIPGMTGATASVIITDAKTNLAALRRLSAKEKYQRVVRWNQEQNCKELYGRSLPALLRLQAG